MINKKQLEEFKVLILNDARFVKIIHDISLYKGKESGHTHASTLEDLISKILMEKYPDNCDVPMDKKGKRLSRALADLIFSTNLINIKTGQDKMGQPNMCSMTRVLENFIFSNEMDSYTIIKCKTVNNKFSLKLFDMFDVIDYLDWNAGTGQIMLKEKNFYDKYDENKPSLTLEEKKQKMYNLWVKGEFKHMKIKMKQIKDGMAKATELGFTQPILSEEDKKFIS